MRARIFKKIAVKTRYAAKLTGDNTPAMIYTKEIVPGDQVKNCSRPPGGFGGENMSQDQHVPNHLQDYRESKFQALEVVEDQDLTHVHNGSRVVVRRNLCPIMYFLRKKALMRPLVSRTRIHSMLILRKRNAGKRVNKLGIRYQGFGGKASSHRPEYQKQAANSIFAGMPCAVNILHCINPP